MNELEELLTYLDDVEDALAVATQETKRIRAFLESIQADGEEFED